MLKAAVSALRAGREPDLSAPLGVTTEINLHVPALLPAAYCSDVHERLVLYKRLANCETADELEAMQEELVDRFGARPSRRRRCSRATGCGSPPGRWASSRSTPGRSARRCSSSSEPPFDPGTLILLVQKDGRIRFAGPDRVRIERAAPTLADRVALVKDFVGRLA